MRGSEQPPGLTTPRGRTARAPAARPPHRLEEAACTDSGFEPQPLIGRGFSYRHDWGDRHGEWVLQLRWPLVRDSSQVFVALSEGGPGGVRGVGAARYTLHNVAPYAGGVDIWVSIAWDTDLRLYADYLVIIA